VLLPSNLDCCKATSQHHLDYKNRALTLSTMAAIYFTNFCKKIKIIFVFFYNIRLFLSLSPIFAPILTTFNPFLLKNHISKFSNYLFKPFLQMQFLSNFNIKTLFQHCVFVNI